MPQVSFRKSMQQRVELGVVVGVLNRKVQQCRDLKWFIFPAVVGLTSGLHDLGPKSSFAGVRDLQIEFGQSEPHQCHKSRASQLHNYLYSSTRQLMSYFSNQ
jgi:hypothetical protein